MFCAYLIRDCTTVADHQPAIGGIAATHHAAPESTARSQAYSRQANPFYPFQASAWALVRASLPKGHIEDSMPLTGHYLFLLLPFAAFLFVGLTLSVLKTCLATLGCRGKPGTTGLGLVDCVLTCIAQWTTTDPCVDATLRTVEPFRCHRHGPHVPSHFRQAMYNFAARTLLKCSRSA